MTQDPNEPGALGTATLDDPVPPARSDPVRGAFPGQEFVYELIQTVWSAWARQRYRNEFDRVAAFCLFIGYPRSGHSLVGAMLNAHRHAVIAHELDAPQLVLAGASRDVLYSRILARAAWFNLRGNTSNYAYQIPNRWQGRFTELRVIGDKRGGSVALWLGQHRDLLARLRATTGVPLRLIHVVRNPYDNIAAIARWHSLSLDQSIDFYFSHCQTTGMLDSYANTADVLTIRHEELVRRPELMLIALCAFLALDCTPDYLAACSSIVFAKPTQPRRRITWSAQQVASVERRARLYPFLDGYGFDTADKASTRAAPTRTPAAQLRKPGIDRVAAFFNPRVRA